MVAWILFENKNPKHKVKQIEAKNSTALILGNTYATLKKVQISLSGVNSYSNILIIFLIPMVVKNDIIIPA